ncbi:hypothetical protein Syun_021176 [Stephania yunnanensis]|uniref:Uncharacterized protein n=1 Tax=Stephania yunnanensis TaxID=152371 RepID=A0AAP0IF73_9MAGN
MGTSCNRKKKKEMKTPTTQQPQQQYPLTHLPFLLNSIPPTNFPTIQSHPLIPLPSSSSSLQPKL